MAIIKLQASEETTYEEACILASKLIEPYSEAYNKEIEKQIMKHDRSARILVVPLYSRLRTGICVFTLTVHLSIILD